MVASSGSGNTQTFVYTSNPQVSDYTGSLSDLANNGGGIQPSDLASRSIDVMSFPADLHSNPRRASHVMQININQNTVSDPSAFLSAAAKTTLGLLIPGSANIANITGAPDDRGGFKNPLTSFGTARMKGAIFLYMPATVQYTNTHEYSDISLTGLAGDAAKAGLNIATAIFGGEAGLLSNFLGATSKVGDFIGNEGQVAAQLGGLPINPKVEVLYAQTPQRTFQFDFLFAPTSPEETNTLYKIIRALRSEAAPEPVNGIFWRAPSTFDISFLHNGAENFSIPKIQECVLTQIDVDYAPSGTWSTFTNGYPTQVKLQLRFRERWPNDKQKIDQGY